ncbi:hypothetical protein SESBI_06084 [Sesbania bispinosa]|nr:hypothetical protein SESBI_06084 [Sesbania bispinosa]
MRNMSSVKQEFLRKWITGLRKCSCEKKNMRLMERKKAIKRSADLAMASPETKPLAGAVLLLPMLPQMMLQTANS